MGHDPQHDSTHVDFGTQADDTMTVRPGDVAFGLHGDDAITVSPVIGTGDVTGEECAFVFGGQGNDTITDGSVKESVFPITAYGGQGNDTFQIPSVDDPNETSYLTGGQGHDLFVFSTQPFHAVHNTTIADFNHQDAIQLDLDPNNPANIAFNDHGGSTELVATTAIGATVDLQLTGNFDESQFHVTNDGEGHAIITYGHGGHDWFMS